MIPVPFDYARPTSAREAVSLLSQAGEDAKVLAGGQSLLPVLRLRLAAPSVLIDLGGCNDLVGIREDGDWLVIGAMTTHADVASDQLVKRYAPLVAQAAQTIGDRQVRHLGTFGGSLSHADPAADLPSVVTAMEGTMVLAGPRGVRQVPASEFFVDYLTTAMRPDEILMEVRLPKLAGWSTWYQKFNRVAQAWAIVGVAAAVRRDNGHIADARVALTNMGPTPVRATTVEQALIGVEATPEAIATAAEFAPEGTSPADDVTGSAEYRRHLATVLTRRAISKASGM